MKAGHGVGCLALASYWCWCSVTMVISMATDQASIPFSWPAGASPEQRPYYLAPVLYFFFRQEREKGSRAFH